MFRIPRQVWAPFLGMYQRFFSQLLAILTARRCFHELNLLDFIYLRGRRGSVPAIL